MMHGTTAWRMLWGPSMSTRPRTPRGTHVDTTSLRAGPRAARPSWRRCLDAWRATPRGPRAFPLVRREIAMQLKRLLREIANRVASSNRMTTLETFDWRRKYAKPRRFRFRARVDRLFILMLAPSGAALHPWRKRKRNRNRSQLLQ